MYQWRTHLAYGGVQQIAFDEGMVYAKTSDALFSVDKETLSVQGWSKLTGLNGAEVGAMEYNSMTQSLLIVYADGMIDILDNGTFYSMTDLKMKEISGSKAPNRIYMYGSKAYLAMSFGVMCIDMLKREIADTYFFGDNGYINIKDVTIWNDTLLAISSSTLYRSALNSWSLSDYHTWEQENLGSQLKQVIPTTEGLWLLNDTMVYHHVNGAWQQEWSEYAWRKLVSDNGKLYLLPNDIGLYCLQQDGTLTEALPIDYVVNDIKQDGSYYWLATNDRGVVYYRNGEENWRAPNGPASNLPYRLKFMEGNLYVTPGARWAAQEARAGNVSVYNGRYWRNIYQWAIMNQSGMMPALDMMNAAQDPFDADHFWVTSYGTGLYEFKNDSLLKRYDYTNSPIVTLVLGTHAQYYMRTDAAVYDESGNLWFINCNGESISLHILSPAMVADAHTADSAIWYVFPVQSGGTPLSAATPQEMFFDNRDNNYLWLPQARVKSALGGIILYDYNGTPFNKSDDKAILRTSFTDEDSKHISMERTYTAVQDLNGDVWVGYDNGTFVIRHTTDFFKSDLVERVKIPRNDGTNLADYLLNGVQVNAIAVDGSNRKWFGTANSGLYLMSADGITTIEHFTEENSPLLSNEILSLAIDPESGRVYVGTAAGLMSYQSDATEAKADFSSVYAYPNPVRPDYTGVITIMGLMDNTYCYILDAGGNLVAKILSNGGTAVWNGLRANGERATAGIYSVLCNTADGANHVITKIMVIW